MNAAEPVIVVRDGFCLLGNADTTVAALRGINLVVSSGERIVVHGPNGSGKTTLLRVLIGEQRLHAGEAHVAGWAVGRGRRRGLAEWRARHVGWIDQHTGRTLRPELDVLGNVALQMRLIGAPANTAREAARQALEQVGVEALASRTIEGLSGGEAQRVAVAAALVHRPTVVLADEPAGQLDAAQADEIYAILADAVHGSASALVMVSHDDRAARVADRVVRIRDGRTSETWRPGEPGGEGLIVDPHGWVRLPSDVRRALGDAGAIRLTVADRDAVLRPAPDLSEPRPPDPPADPDQLFRRPPAVAPAEDAARMRPIVVKGVADDAAVHAAVVHVAAATRTFEGRRVLDVVDLAARAGEVVLIEGRSGSGKSTLLRIVAGLDDPESGEVRLCGELLAALDRERRAVLRRTSVAMVLQDIHLAESATLLHNLAIARTVRRLPADPAADRALLETLGLGELTDRVAGRCSGGERQRAAIARSIVAAPRVVMLDEPTSQLDETSAELVVRVIAALAESGAAVLVASHDPLLETVATRVVGVAPGV